MHPYTRRIFHCEFVFKFANYLSNVEGSFSAVQVPARVPKRAPLVELVLTMTSMRRERKDRYWQCVCGGDHTDQRYRDGSKGSEGSTGSEGSEGSEGVGGIASDREGS